MFNLLFQHLVPRRCTDKLHPSDQLRTLHQYTSEGCLLVLEIRIGNLHPLGQPVVGTLPFLLGCEGSNDGSYPIASRGAHGIRVGRARRVHSDRPNCLERPCSIHIQIHIENYKKEKVKHRKLVDWNELQYYNATLFPYALFFLI